MQYLYSLLAKCEEHSHQLQSDISQYINSLNNSLRLDQEDLVKLGKMPSSQKMRAIKSQEISFLEQQIERLNHLIDSLETKQFRQTNYYPNSSYPDWQNEESHIEWELSSKNSLANIIEIDLNTIENGNFAKLIQNIIDDQNEFQSFTKNSARQGMNLAKGVIGETLCGLVLGELYPNLYFLSGQMKSIDTVNEELSYQAAQDFFSQNPDYKFAVAGRPFGGGQPYSVDVVYMLINRTDVENWINNKESTATYFVFEAKTDSSPLKKEQQQFSYVQNKAKQMAKSNIDKDRTKVGKDILKALEDDRVLYAHSHIDTTSGKMKVQLIE